MGKLRVKTKILGIVRTNCYLVMNTETKEAIIIDPADSAETVIAAATTLEVKPVGILLTHGHFDHIGAAAELSKHYGIEVAAGSAEAQLLKEAELNLSTQIDTLLSVIPERLFRDREMISLAGFQIQVFYTPGHTSGGVCYYFPEEEVMFTGDTLFYESIGRTDLPTGSAAALVRSVQELLNNIPEITTVYPGHGSRTTIAHEKAYNSFI